jgi:sarcosine oxidase/L-pipecolate oxidase
MNDKRVLIVGAGCFGVSTAYHLLKRLLLHFRTPLLAQILDRGYSDVTIIDRAAKLPASDAASTDINKLCRCM